MNKERLIILRDGLVKIAERSAETAEVESTFNMEQWFTGDLTSLAKGMVAPEQPESDDPDFWTKYQVQKTQKLDVKAIKECGTAACALGWGCAMPELQAQGLKVEISLNYSGEIAVAPSFKGAVGFDAAEKFFDIDYRTASYLFDPYEYGDSDVETVTVGEVIARIDAVLSATAFNDEEEEE